MPTVSLLSALSKSIVVILKKGETNIVKRELKSQMDKEGVTRDPGTLSEFQAGQRTRAGIAERAAVDNL